MIPLDVWSLLKIMNTFGDLLQMVSIDLNYGDDGFARQIIELVNEKVTSPSYSLRIYDCKMNYFDELTEPFYGVTDLILTSNNDEKLEFYDGELLVNLFPNIESLRLDQPTELDWVFINGHFPLLTSFRIALKKTKTKDDEIYESTVISFLEKNPNIENLEIDNFNVNFLTKVNELLPGLKKLSLWSEFGNNLGDENHEIRFKNVEELFIQSFHEFPTNIYFDNLQTLKLQTVGKFTDDWFEFCISQVNADLKELQISTTDITSEHFLIIPHIFNQLTSMDIACDKHISPDDINIFTTKCKHLQQFSSEIHYKEITDLESIYKSTEWNIQFNTKLSHVLNKFTIIKR